MGRRFHNYAPLVETIGDASSAAEAKCQLNVGQGIALGVVAAAYLALATTLSLAVGATIQSPSVQKLLMGAVFPVGLIAVVVAVSELSTGNYLVTPLGAMTGCIHWKHVLYNWAVSYVGNFLGAFLLAVVIIDGAHVLTGAMWGQPWVDLLTKMVTLKASLSPTEAFWRGFLCIWLVDLAVWQAYRVKDYTARFLLIWFPTFTFFTLSLEHSVVNMFLFPAAIFAGADISWRAFLLNNLTPVVLGNVVGGLFVVGMLYWFSAGLPVVSLSLGNGNPTGSGVHHVQGSYGLLGANLFKGLTVIAVFFALFPGGAALVSLVMPQGLGVLVPTAVILYLAVVTYLVSLSGRRGEG
ncbi:MAG: formate/nitrite transporter family protein [Chloroflexi bacterium]|nr:formate/nitrite transporter family protein [Chloroflexota bacterium]